jgi:hypothetical protein
MQSLIIALIDRAARGHPKRFDDTRELPTAQFLTQSDLDLLRSVIVVGKNRIRWRPLTLFRPKSLPKKKEFEPSKAPPPPIVRVCRRKKKL